MTDEKKSQEKKEKKEVHPIFAPILAAMKGEPIKEANKEKKND